MNTDTRHPTTRRPAKITATNARFRADVPGAPGPLTVRQALVIQAARELAASGQPATIGAIARRVGIGYDTSKAIVRRLREVGVEDFEVVPYRELPSHYGGHSTGRPPGEAGADEGKGGKLTDAELAARIEAARREVEARRAAGTLGDERFRGRNRGREGGAGRRAEA